MTIRHALIEGVHLRRGFIATLCCLRALPNLPVIGLSWKGAFSSLPITVEPYSTVKSYYVGLGEHLKRSQHALVVPCTQQGTIICNDFSNNNLVLAEPITQMRSFDKLHLRKEQPLLTAFFPPYGAVDAKVPFPVIAKPRLGHSSTGQVICRNPRDIYDLRNASTYYLEAIIPHPFEEYSLTAVRSAGKTTWMCIRRISQTSGRTVKAGLLDNIYPLAAAKLIAKNLNFTKIFNVQFSLQPGKTPFIYDLNPRFGYSELFRASFGFNFVSAFLDRPSPRFAGRRVLDEDSAVRLLQRKRPQ